MDPWPVSECALPAGHAVSGLPRGRSQQTQRLWDVLLERNELMCGTGTAGTALAWRCALRSGFAADAQRCRPCQTAGGRLRDPPQRSPWELRHGCHLDPVGRPARIYSAGYGTPSGRAVPFTGPTCSTTLCPPPPQVRGTAPPTRGSDPLAAARRELARPRLGAASMRGHGALMARACVDL